MDNKYPRDLAMMYNGKTKALNVEGHLYRAALHEGCSPFTNYNAFSRFKFTFIDKTNGSEYVVANIKPMDDIPDLVERTRFANKRIYESELKRTSTATAADGSRLTSPAYTVRFTNGYMKGKTPAEVLNEEGAAGREKLKNQYIFLKENLIKYKNNKTQMDAIAEAINAYDAGTLSKVEGGASGAAIKILEQEMRPLVHKDQKYGKTFVYEIGVMCYPERNYPYSVTIENYYAPVIKKEDGTLNVQKKDAQDMVSKTFNMTSKMWNALLQAITTHMRQFEDIIARTQFSEAEKADMANRQANSGRLREAV